jgi:hypothetical protein
MKSQWRLCIALCFALLATNLSNPAASQTKRPRSRTRSTTSQTSSGPFTPSCDSPSFPQPAPSSGLAIDSSCGLPGSGGAEANQNTAKNNFCASGAPEKISFDFLKTLQASVESDTSIDFGDQNSPNRHKGPTVDRAPLQNLGEGKLVTLTAFVLVARQEGAESVNCGKNVPNSPGDHDIHISLVSLAQTTDECSGIVAEMIPHHRPDSWTAKNVLAVADAKAPVRVTGQMLFDSSHVPCSAGARVRSNPSRMSLWEIHPIYSFEVGDGSGNWTSLDQWVSQQSSGK